MSGLRTGTFRRLIWVIPTIVIVLAADWGPLEGLALPLPILLLFASVIIAGSFGGFWAGTLSGLVAASEIHHSYFADLGPQDMTISLLSAALGSVIFMGAGAKLGQQKDQNDALVAELRETKRSLEHSVVTTSIERDTEADKVAERDEQLRQALRLSGVGFFRWNAVTGNCEFCSEAHAAHFGLTPQEFQAKTKGPEPYVGYVHEEDRDAFLSAIARIDDGEPLPFDYRIVLPNGKVRYLRQLNEPVFDDNGVEVAVVGSSIDFTDLHEAEELVRRSQRNEVIGNLTGGVAHDFNNLLAIILGNLELLLLSDDPNMKRELVQEAIKATNRGADLTKNLLSFARRAHLTPTRLNLNQLVNTSVNWSSRILPANLHIETSLFAGLWDTELDAASAESALINLLLNARDAMPEGGKLTIETANIRIGQEYIGDRQEVIEPGRYAMLAVSDTGHGIASDKLDQIFEPFYSEKPVGKGTGLGLSMVQGFIKQSKGTIFVYSEVGVGTTFKLYLRATEGLPECTEVAVRTVMPPSKEGARILMAEDEGGVASVIKATLESANHVVTMASSGDDAFKVFSSSGPFDILLTDIVMPGTLQGPALANAIRTICPDIPCIFLSGYAAEATIHGIGLKPTDIRLMKPVSRDHLLASISEAWALGGEKNNDGY